MSIEQPVINATNGDNYFTEAWDWYADQYLKPIIEKAWSMVLALISIVLFVIFLAASDSIFPLTKSMPFTMYIDSSTDNLYVIKSLSQTKHSTPQLALAEYLIKNYIMLREQYDYSNLQVQQDSIKANSSHAVYKQFMEQINVNKNVNSPLLQYGKEGKRSVNIRNITIDGTGSGTGSARVNFITSDNVTNTIKEQNVMLRFTLSNIVSSVLKLVPLDFRVIAYGK